MNCVKTGSKKRSKIELPPVNVRIFTVYTLKLYVLKRKLYVYQKYFNKVTCVYTIETFNRLYLI